MVSHSQKKADRKEKKRQAIQEREQAQQQQDLQGQNPKTATVVLQNGRVETLCHGQLLSCLRGAGAGIARALCQCGPTLAPGDVANAPSPLDAQNVPNDSSAQIAAEVAEAAADAIQKDIADSFSEGPIMTLSLSQRCPSQVPPSLFSEDFDLAASLLSLDLSQNKLQDLPAAIGKLSALTELNVSRNWLRALPTEVGQLTRLVKLDAFMNDLQPRTLCIDALSSLPQLQVLDLRYNNKLKEATVALLTTRLPAVEVLFSLRLPFDQRPHAADRDARFLQSQLEPLCTLTLRRRLALLFGEATNPAVVLREEVMRRLLACYAEAGSRAERHISGVPVSSSLCDELLEEMKGWVKVDDSTLSLRERPSIRAQHYMILRSENEFVDKLSNNAVKAASKLRQYAKMWALARRAADEVDVAFAEKYTAIAFTHNFEGSPHIDRQNIGPFYALGLGDFAAGGGALCVECSAHEVAHIDTRNRLAKVDGRFPHWVAPYEGDRFSVIYYQTLGEPTTQTTAVFSGEPLVNDPLTFCSPSGYQYKYCIESETFCPSEEDAKWLANRT